MRYSCCQTVTDEGVRTSDRVRCQNEDTVQSFVVDSCCQTLTDEGVRTSDRVRCQTDDEMVPKLTDRLRKICVFAGAASKSHKPQQYNEDLVLCKFNCTVCVLERMTGQTTR